MRTVNLARRRVRRDEVLRREDVEFPEQRVIDSLRAEQDSLFPVPPVAT